MDKIRRIDFSPDEFLAGISRLGSPTIIGCYWIVCSLIYSKGEPIDDDADWIAKVCQCRPSVWRGCRTRLLALGKLVEIEHRGRRCLMNGRSELELTRAERRTVVARSNANQRWQEVGRKSEGSRQDRTRSNGHFQRVSVPVRNANHQLTESHDHKKSSVAARASRPAPRAGRTHDTENEWRARLHGYHPGGAWEAAWGPRPESGRCRAPQYLVDHWRTTTEGEP